jgi:integrase
MARKPYFRAFDGWWYAQVRVGAKRKQIKLVKGKENEQEAYRAFCRVLADHEGDAPPPTAMTVAAVCDLFLDQSEKNNKPETFQLYRYYLQDFCETHGRRMVVELKPFHVTRWLDSHPTWKGSRCNAIEAVKRAFGWATAEGLLSKNPIQGIKKPAKGRRDRIVSSEERAAILAAIKDEPFREFVSAMQETGCRPSEVARVTAADVNLEAGLWVLKLHKTARKTRRPRVVYLTPAMLELTRKLAAKYPDGPLFRGPRGGKAFSRNNIRCRFRRLREKLPHLAGVVAYSYRHTFATEALANGVGIAQVAELMGHTSTEMVSSVYGHLADRLSHMRDAAKKAVR